MWQESGVLGSISGEAGQGSIGVSLPEVSEGGGKALVAGEVKVGHVAG
jgi:hypothetical protein